MFLYYQSPYTTTPPTLWFYNMQKSLQRTNWEMKTAAGYNEYHSVDDYRETNHLPMRAAVLFCSSKFLFVNCHLTSGSSGWSSKMSKAW